MFRMWDINAAELEVENGLNRKIFLHKVLGLTKDPDGGSPFRRLKAHQN